MRTRRWFAAGALLLAAGCAQRPVPSDPHPAPSYVGTAVLDPAANEDPTLWDYQLRDVVSLADHVAVVTVLGQKQVTVRQSEQDGGDWHLTRATLRVDRVVWSRRGAKRAPDSLVFTDLYRRRLSGTLMVPIVKLDSWSPLTGTSFLGLDVEPQPPPGRVGTDDGWREGVRGLSIDGLGDKLDATRPWPGVDMLAPLQQRREQAAKHFP